MKSTRRFGHRIRATVASMAMLVLVSVAAPVVTASTPEIVRLDIDRVTVNNRLTAACGIPVMSHVQGHLILRTSTGGPGVAEVAIGNLAVVATAGDNTYRYRNVGAEIVQVKPGGVEILVVAGQAPFLFAGALKIDLATGDLILEPQHSLEGDLAEACAALTA